MFGLKIRADKENKYYPSVVFQNIKALFGTCLDYTNYTATYLTLSKILEGNYGKIDL